MSWRDGVMVIFGFRGVGAELDVVELEVGTAVSLPGGRTTGPELLPHALNQIAVQTDTPTSASRAITPTVLTGFTRP